jgi:hypothetical protein
MEPSQLAKSGTEDGEQMALFCWARNEMNEGRYPMLEWMFAIPNGGSRGSTKDHAMAVGARLKATGVKAGVSDIFLPWPLHNCNGLFIEMKRANGKPSDVKPEQKLFGEEMQRRGYGFVVCYGWEQARDVLEQYLSS